jgi:hypothetical protein
MARKRAPKRKNGRPSAYKAVYAKMAYRHCLLGATNVELGKLFSVSAQTIDAWMKAHPKFLDAIKAGREDADSRVARALYHRAIGYSHPAVKILSVSGGPGAGSSIEEVPYIEHYPPDTKAAQLWLNNRQPERWRDRREVEMTVVDKRAERLQKARLRLVG